MIHSFTSQLLHRLAADLTKYRTCNTDSMRFTSSMSSPMGRLAQRISAMFDCALAKLDWVRDNAFHRAGVQQRLDDLEPYLLGLEWLYHRLADDVSRNTLVEVIAFRLLGSRHTQLARNNAAFWKAVGLVQTSAVTKKRVGRMDILDGWLDDYDLSVCGFDVRLRAHKLSVLNTFFLEQYRFNESGAPIVGVKTGDIIVDGGGCWGDTALYFAHETGSAGQVHVFEFSPANLAVMRFNLASNPVLAPRVRIHEEAVWNLSGETLHYGEAGPATTLSNDSSAGTLSAHTRSIDDWATNSNVEGVDFIKLDIEGAEAKALEGAKQVIRQHKPKLAVALYHSLADFVELPQLIDSMLPEYRFHLGHYTIHAEETILFATCE